MSESGPHAKKPCCTPETGRGGSARMPVLQAGNSAARLRAAAVPVAGGEALLGTDREGIPHDGETPLRRVTVRPFRIGATVVTNAEFAEFVAATGHVTESERFGWSFVFWSEIPDHVGPTQAVVDVTWWRRVEGADWRNINGPGTEASAWRVDHPVVHVSWNDATAYAAWAGGRLPTEAEWEHAARGGLGAVEFPWGDREPNDTDFLPCNIWQGTFPSTNTCADGHRTTAPARSFAPNGHGLYNMVGNVWEWTSEPFRIRSLKKQARQKLAAMKGFKLMKGGSFLCHRSYCYRYRIAARTGTSPDSSTAHQGIRIVWDG